MTAQEVRPPRSSNFRLTGVLFAVALALLASTAEARWHKLGDRLYTVVRFNGDLIIKGGYPYLELTLDSGTVQAVFVGSAIPSATNTQVTNIANDLWCTWAACVNLSEKPKQVALRSMVFRHTIQPGDYDANGATIYADALNWNGAEVTDLAFESVSLPPLPPLINDPTLKVDGIPPWAWNVRIISTPIESDTYRSGERIKAQVDFSEPVTVAHTPLINLDMILADGGGYYKTVRMEYQAVPPEEEYHHHHSRYKGEALFFGYTVQDSDLDEDGISIGADALFTATSIGADALSLTSGSITDEAGNPADLSLATHAITNNPGHKVVGAGPRVTGVSISSTPANGYAYRKDEKIKIAVFFDDTLVGDVDNLRLTLNLGSAAVVAQEPTFSSSILFDNPAAFFTYTVQDGDLDHNGISIGADALSLTGGNVTNSADQRLILNLAEHAITDNPGHKVDGVGPRVEHVGIESEPENGHTYRQGEVIEILLSFNQTITGDVDDLRFTLNLDSGAVVSGRYFGGPTRYATFFYIVQDGDLDHNGISIGVDALSLANGGTLTDRAGNRADLSLAAHAITDNPGHKVDGGGPRVTGVGISSTPANGHTYQAGEEIRIAMFFDEILVGPVYNLRLTLNLGSAAVVARETELSDLNQTALFTYTVQDGDLDEDGISIGADALSLIGGNVTNSADQRLILSLAAHTITDNPRHKVDGSGPRVTAVGILSTPVNGDTYLEGEEITVSATFDEPLVGDVDNLRLTLNLGPAAVVAQETELSDLNQTASFTYTVQDGDLDEDGISIGADALSLTGGSTTDEAGNPADLSLAAHAITDNPGHKVDGGGPRVTRVVIRSLPANGDAYQAGEEIRIAMFFNETIVGDLDNLRLTLNLDSAAVVSQQPDFPPSSLNRYAFFPYTVQDGDLDQDGISIAADALSLTGGNVTNAADKRLILSLAAHTITDNPRHKVDTVQPEVTGLSILSTPNGLNRNQLEPENFAKIQQWYGIGDEIEVEVRFNKLIRGDTENLNLTLSLNPGPVSAQYQVQRNKSRALFTYTVQEGDLDEDGISIAAHALSVTSGSLTDAFGKPVNLDLTPFAIGNDGNHKVDGVPPQVQSATIRSTPLSGGDTYGLGEPILVRVDFTEPVVYEDRQSKYLLLNLEVGEDEIITGRGPKGETTRTEQGFYTYTRQTFWYNVRAGEYDPDGISINKLALDEDGVARATDLAGNPVILPFPAHVAIPDQPEHKVDARAPRVTGVGISSEPANGHTYREGEKIIVAMFFDETLVGDVDNLRLTLNLGSAAVVARETELSDLNQTALFTYTVQDGDLDQDGISIGADALSVVDGGSVTDEAGNPADLSLAKPIIDDGGHKVDAAVPGVTGLSIISTPNGRNWYGIGDEIEVEVRFDEPVVGDRENLNLTLILNSGLAVAQYQVHENESRALFTYTVQEGDVATNGIGIAANALNVASGGLADAAGNDVMGLALTAFAFDHDRNHLVDGVSPRVESATIISTPQTDDTYLAGEEIEVDVMFTERVVYEDFNDLRLKLTLGEDEVITSGGRLGSTTNQFFHYVTKDGDYDPDGISFNELRLAEGGSAADVADNPVILTFPDHAILGDQPGHKVDTVAPQITNMRIISAPQQFGYYGTGERITARVNFNEPVTVGAGIPVLSMSLGDAAPRLIAMEYRAVRAQDDFLLFGYTVQAGDDDHNGVGIAADALSVSGDMITDIAGNPLETLDLSAFAFDNDARQKVDAIGPRVTSIEILPPSRSNPAPNTFKLGDTILVRVRFEQGIYGVQDGQEDLRLVLSMESGNVILRGTHELSALVSFRHTIQNGDLDEDGISIGADALSVAEGSSVTDYLGNAVDLSLAHVALTDDPTRKVDGVPPDITAPPAMTFEATGVMTPLDRSHYDTATSTDPNADITDDAPTVFPLGDTSITWTATDPAGNEESATQVVTVVDTTGPRVTSIEILPPTEDKPDPHFFKLDEPIYVRVQFDDDLYGDGGLRDATELRLVLSIDRNNVILSGTTQHSSGYVEFQHIVQPGNLDLDGLSIKDHSLMASGRVTDSLGNRVNLRMEHVVITNDPTRKVDGVPSEVRSAYIVGKPQTGDTYRAGEQISVFVTFSDKFLQEDMEGLRLKLNLGATEVITTERQPVSIPGVNIEQFRYTVQDGDYDPDGISFNELHLAGGGSVTDPAGNPLPLIFPDHVAVADHPEHKVDAVAPQVTAVSITSSPQQFGYYVAGERITARVDFNESVTVADGTTPVLQMSLGDATPRLVAMEYEEMQAGADSMLFGYTVQTGDEDNNGIGIGADALEVTGGSLTDTLGNPAADLGLTAFAIENDSEHKVDGVVPDITAPADMTIEATAAETPLTADDYSSATSTDGTADISSNAPSVFPLGATTITWTATDPAGNEMTAPQVVTIVDTTKPVIALLGDNPQTVEFGSIYNDPGATATDAVDDNDELTIRIAAVSTVNTGTVGDYTVTYTVSDKATNAATPVTRMVTVTDTEAPDITAPAAYTTEATATLTPLDRSDYGIATSPDREAMITDDAPPVFPLGDTTITWTATDKSTNEMMDTQVVTIVDTTKPVIALLGADPQTVEFGTTYTELNATATDEVDDDDELTRRIVIDANAVDVDLIGTYAVTYDVTDAEGNAADRVTRMVMVTDTVIPDITAPLAITFEATDTLTPLSRSDYGTATSGDDTADITDDAPDAFPLGATTITWTATDPATNEMMATQVVTIVDTTKPVIALLGADPQTVEFGTTYTELNATATDEVDDDDELTRRIVIDANAVDVDLIGTYAVTYDVTDAEGNAADRVTRMVMVTDTVIPDITAPLAMTFEATDTLTPLSRSDYGTATSGDDTADITDDAPDAFPLGATTITWTATDPATNEMMATQVVTIVDTTPPDIALLGADPQTVEFGSIYNDPGATATDAVDDDDELTIRIAAASTVDTGTVGDYTVTYTVSDTATNAATPVIRMVTVTDTTAPDIIAPANMTFEATDTLTPLGRTHYGTATSTDREAMITDDAPLAFSVGVHTITWRATDTNTLFSTAAQTITITDTTKPDIAAPRNITKEATGPTTPVTVGWAIATDLVTDPVRITRSPEGNEFAVGTHTITWKADDGNGNIIIAEQTITITDTTPPVIVLLGDNPQTVEFGSIYNDPGATVTDAVDDDDELTIRIAAASTVNTGTVGDYTVTYTVSDKATNAATPVIRIVTVTDTTEPDITAPANMTFEATDTLTPLSRSDYGIATSGDDTADITDDAPDAFPLGATTITWTATDPATNEMIATQVVTIVDTTAPDIASIPRNITKEATGPTTPVTVGLATATDLVTDPVIITRTPEADAFAVGTHTITWKADDGNGNIITAAQTITITDTTKPVIALLGDNPQTVEFGSVYTDPGATATDAVDDDDELTIRIAAVSTVDTGTVGDYTVTYTVSDTATNAATPVIRMVTVEDTAAPDITAPADITFEATDTLTSLGRSDYGIATSTDDTADITDDAPDAFPLGDTPITWRATDTNTLFSTAAQTITITDTTKPDITAPENITKEATGPTTPVTVGLATATDLVTASVTITRTPEADAFAVGTHTITWKADDGNGNIITAEQTITITDTTPPVIVLLGDNPQTVEFGSTYTDPDATATDLVDDDIKLTEKIHAVSTVDTGTVGDYTVTYTVSDKATNVATPVIRMVTVTDTAAPDIIAPADITFEATDTLTPLSRSDYGTATSGDDTADITDDAPDAFPLGATTITWTATDPATNEMMATQVVTIVDTTPPDIALLGADPQTIEFGSIYNDPGATATDAVDDNDELTTQIAAASTVDTGTVGDYTVTYTVSDKATNAATPVIRMVTVEDTAAPDISPPADMTFEATDTLTPLGRTHYGTATSGDDTADITDNAPPVFPLGATTITWTATDKSTNEMIAAQVVTIVDTTPPVIALLGDNPQTVEFGSIYNDPGATATDAVDDNDELTTQIAAASTVDTGTVGDYTVTYTVSDTATNAATPVLRTVTVEDTAAPDISPPADITFEATDTLTPLDRSDYGIATSGDDTADITDDAPDVFPLGDTPITWTATDKSTNEMMDTQVVTIVDTTKPDIAAPENITKEATGPTTSVTVGQAIATDLVTDPVIITRTPEADAFAVGVHTITWKADDDNGNTSTAEQTITITDTTKPSIALLSDNPQTVEFGTAYTELGATATDLVDDDIKLTEKIHAVSTVDTGTVGDYTVTYTVSDKATNVATPVTRMVTVTDTAAPDIIAPADITFEATDTLTPLGRTHYGTATSGDDTADITDDAPLAFSVGVHTITWTATDTNTLFSTAAQTITITDTTAPDITAPGNIIKEATGPTTPVTVGLATAMDLVTDPVIITRSPEGNEFAVGTHTITWKADDGNGNIITAAQTITITDTTKPVIALLGDNPQTVEFGSIYNDPGATATDAVDDDDELTIRIAAASTVNTGTVGDYTVTYTVSDKATNAATPVIRMVTVTDTEAPDIIAPADITFEATDTLTPLGRTHYGTATSTDREAMITDDAPPVFPLGPTTITWTATDKSTNEMMDTQVVTVVDTTKPDITAPGNITKEATGYTTLVTPGQATATDFVADMVAITRDLVGDEADLVVGSASVGDIQMGNEFAVGTHKIIWTADDGNGNTNTAEQTITITDTTKPDITAPENIIKEATGPTTPVTVGLATATDLVTASVTITRSPTDDAFAVGTHTITWKADDDNGNIITAEQTVTITDITKPVIALLGDNPQTVEFGSVYTDPGATATDAVDDNDELTTQIAADSTVDTGTVGDYTVTYTVSDTARNPADRVTRTVTVTRAPDNQPPFAGTGADRDVPPGTLVTLDGSTSSDPDNDALDYTWTHTSTDRVVTTPSTAITLMTGDDPAMATFTAPASAAILVFTLEVTDGTDTSTGMVTITVTAPTVANTAPSIVGAQLVGRDENGNTVVATYTVPDTENNNITWTLTGADARFFTISTSGALTFRASPDYETKSTYSVIVHATETNGSPSNLDDELEVTVTLENVDETGDIGIIDGVAQVGQVLTAGDVTDPDGGVMVTTYAWQDAADDSSIATGPENTYTLMATDEGKTIQVVATYTDSFGAQTVTSIPTAMVVAADAPDPVSDIDLAVDTGSSPTDGITQNGRVNVTLASDFDSARGDTWKYSIKGSGFSTGTDTFFTLDEGVYAATDVQVVQTLLGTDSPARSLRAVTVDKTAPTVTRVGAASVILLVGASYTDEGVNPPATGDTQTTVITDSDDRAVAAVDTRTAGTYTYTYTATDVAGNAATVTRMVTVTDTPLDITAPPDMTFEATAVMTPLSRSDYGTATSGDDTADITDDAPDAFPLGETMIEWTATDTNNLRSSAQQMITVEDTIKPIITLLGDNPMTIEVGEDYMEPGATAFDRMDSDLTDQIAIDATEVDTNTVGTYTVTYSVADLQDNQAQASRSVQVLASPDLADLNRVILSEVARAIADQNISTIASRVERLRTQPNGAGFNFAGQQMSFGGNDNESMSSTVANLMRSHGQALADDTLDMKTLLGNSDFSIVIPAQSGIQSDYEPGLVGNETGISLSQTNYATAPIPGTLTLWGSGDYRNLSGEDKEQTLDWDGDLFSLHLGVDAHITAEAIGGVALSWSEGEMDTNKDKIKETYDTSMTSINPYLGWSDEYGEVWMTAGYSKGELERDIDGTTSTNDLSMQTFAIGGNSILLQRGADTLRLKGEISQSVLAVDANQDRSGLPEMEVDANRARLSLESTNTVTWGNGARTDRKVELGARHDGGDGVTGTGIELGLGLRHISAAGLSVEGKIRGLLGHEGDINEWGISGTIKQSAGADGQGFSFALSPGYGDDSSDLQRLWEHGLRDADGNASSGTTDADGNADPDYTARTRAYSARLDARIGYGVNGFTAPSWLGSGSGIGLLTPYTAMTLSNDSNRYRLGLQWKLGDHLDFDLLGERQDADDSADTILLKGVLRF